MFVGRQTCCVFSQQLAARLTSHVLHVFICNTGGCSPVRVCYCVSVKVMVWPSAQCVNFSWDSLRLEAVINPLGGDNGFTKHSEEWNGTEVLKCGLLIFQSHNPLLCQKDSWYCSWGAFFSKQMMISRWLTEVMSHRVKSKMCIRGVKHWQTPLVMAHRQTEIFCVSSWTSCWHTRSLWALQRFEWWSAQCLYPKVGE